MWKRIGSAKLIQESWWLFIMEYVAILVPVAFNCADTKKLEQTLSAIKRGTLGGSIA